MASWDTVTDVENVAIHVSDNGEEARQDIDVFITESDGKSQVDTEADIISIAISSEPTLSSVPASLAIIKQSKVAQDVSGNDSGIEDERIGEGDRCSMTEVAKNNVCQIPAGWPRLHEKIFKKKALYFLKPSSSSINKAVEHLDRLQDRLEEWSKDIELEILSRHSSVGHESAKVDDLVSGCKTTEEKSKRRIHFASESSHCDSSLSSKSTLGGLSSDVEPSSKHESSDGLSIQGIGAVIPQVKEPEPIIDEAEEIPNLGAEEVIDEVVTLLGHLETDRLDTEKALAKEKHRVIWLQERIDKLAQQRATELPKAVQNEHEACSMDISELIWHCAYRNRQQNRIKSRVEVAQTLNARLTEDINFVTKHCPLVEEKLELEREAMSMIDSAQEHTTAGLNKTETKQKRTQDKSSEAHGKADMERTHIKKELDSVRDALREIYLELDEAKTLHSTYSHRCNDLRIKINENKQEKIVLETKNQNAKTTEKMTAKKVKHIQEKIVDTEYEHRKLADDNYVIINEIDETKKKIERLSDANDKMEKVTLQELRHMQQRSKELLMENEDIQEKLRATEKQKVGNSKNSERIRREFEKVDDQLKVIDEEYEKIKVIHTAVKNKLVGEEDKTRLTEDSYQGTSDSLRKHLKEETHSRTVLQARIISDTGDLKKQRVEAKKKKAKVSKKAMELSNAVAIILAEVEELRKTHSDKSQTNGNLRQSIEDSKDKTLNTNDALSRTIEELKPSKKHLETQNLNKNKRLDHMQYRTDLIHRKLEEMDQSSRYMSRVITTTEEAIVDLAEEMNEITIQLETGQKMQDDLKLSLDEVTQQIGERSNRHDEHVRERSKVLKDLEAQLHDKLTFNKELASCYRTKQQHVYTIKNKLLNHYEGRIKVESSLKDHKQLNGLQNRLHYNIIEYYKLRGMYNQNQIARFEEISTNNTSKILDVKDDMDTCITTISKFLMDQIDGTAARMVTAAARAVFQEDVVQSGNVAIATS